MQFQVVTSQPAQGAGGYETTLVRDETLPRDPDWQLGLAILNFLCCCCTLGFIALIFSVVVSQRRTIKLDLVPYTVANTCSSHIHVTMGKKHGRIFYMHMYVPYCGPTHSNRLVPPSVSCVKRYEALKQQSIHMFILVQ